MSVSDLHEKPWKEILDQCADIYVGYLKRFQYRPAVIKSYLRGIEHFIDWVGRRRVPLRAVDAVLVRRFRPRLQPGHPVSLAPSATLRRVWYPIQALCKSAPQEEETSPRTAER